MQALLVELRKLGPYNTTCAAAEEGRDVARKFEEFLTDLRARPRRWQQVSKELTTFEEALDYSSSRTNCQIAAAAFVSAVIAENYEEKVALFGPHIGLSGWLEELLYMASDRQSGGYVVG